jgi:hypothetical protein
LSWFKYPLNDKAPIAGHNELAYEYADSNDLIEAKLWVGIGKKKRHEAALKYRL